jgi:hypothetical protein
VGGFSRALKTGGRRAAGWAFPSRRDFEGEEHFIKSRQAPITKRERKTSRKVQEDLRAVRKVLDDYGGIPQSWPAISEKLQTIAPKEHALSQ